MRSGAKLGLHAASDVDRVGVGCAAAVRRARRPSPAALLAAVPAVINRVGAREYVVIRPRDWCLWVHDDLTNELWWRSYGDLRPVFRGM